MNLTKNLGKKKMDKKIKWTKEQEEAIQKMLEESENIGYVQGRDDLLREIIAELKLKFINGDKE